MQFVWSLACAGIDIKQVSQREECLGIDPSFSHLISEKVQGLLPAAAGTLGGGGTGQKPLEGAYLCAPGHLILTGW